MAPAVLVAAFAVLALPGAAHAEAIGPLCWSWSVESEAVFSLVFFVDPAHPDLATVVGKTLASPSLGPSNPISGGAHQNQGISGPEVRMILTVGWLNTLERPLTLNIVFRLSDLTGFGSCWQASDRSPCGAAKALTWTPTPCS